MCFHYCQYKKNFVHSLKMTPPKKKQVTKNKFDKCST